MSLFDHMFDSQYKQRDDINALQSSQLDAATEVMVARRDARRLRGSVERLQLISRVLMEVLVRKKLATWEEMEVMIQQIDLLDGVEDGGSSSTTMKDAPRCGACGYFVNPQREACVYCETPIRRTESADGSPYRGGPGAKEVAIPMATCGKCDLRVPQAETLFDEQGVLTCGGCR